MIKRTNKQFIKELIERNPDWNIVDSGCSRWGWEQANTLVDISDLKHLYPGKRFVQSDVRKTPFKDNEFDFAIASHILEHIPDADVFIAELQRISKRGYVDFLAPPRTLEVHNDNYYNGKTLLGCHYQR